MWKLQVSKKHWHPSSEKKKKKIMQVLGFPLSRVLKSPFVICSKMAAVGNRKHLFVVVWFASPCSNMFTARGPADRKNIWLLCTAERVHIYYTWRAVHLPESQPVCSSISANTRTHDKTLLLWCLQAAKWHKYFITFISYDPSSYMAFVKVFKWILSLGIFFSN